MTGGVEWKDRGHVPKATGWELEKAKIRTRYINLATSMDPYRCDVHIFLNNLFLFFFLYMFNLDYQHSQVGRICCRSEFEVDEVESSALSELGSFIFY